MLMQIKKNIIVYYPVYKSSYDQSANKRITSFSINITKNLGVLRLEYIIITRYVKIIVLDKLEFVNSY